MFFLQYKILQLQHKINKFYLYLRKKNMKKQVQLLDRILEFDLDFEKIGALKMMWLQRLFIMYAKTDFSFEGIKTQLVEMLRVKKQEPDKLNVAFDNFLKSFYAFTEFNYTYKGLAFALLSLPNKSNYTEKELESLYLEYLDLGLTDYDINEVVDFFFRRFFEQIESLFSE